MRTDTIPGTANLPDHPIHRASLWLEEVKQKTPFGQVPHDMYLVHVNEVLEELGWEQEILNGEDVLESARFYVGSAMQLGLQMGYSVEAMRKLIPIFLGVWADGFMHGVCTQARKYGQHDPNWRSGPDIVIDPETGEERTAR